MERNTRTCSGSHTLTQQQQQQQHLVYELGVEVGHAVQGGVPKGAAQPGASAQAGAAVRGEQTQIHTQDWFHEG